MRKVLFVCALAACGGGTPGEMDVQACMDCADLTTHAWCASSGSCQGINDDCEYGALTADHQCEEPQLFQPTMLAIDCRKTENANDPRCGDTTSVQPHTIGKGPMDNFYSFGGGFLDTAKNRLVVAFSCDICSGKDSGIMAIDLTTGDRTLLSGKINDTLNGIQTKGSGDAFTSLDDVEVAPNGKWWALDSISAGAMIFEVDPATGNRTDLFTQDQLSRDKGICKLNNQGFALGFGSNGNSFTSGLANMVVEPDGTIYIRGGDAYDSAVREIDWYGIAALKDGACKIVSAYSSKNDAYNVGQGPTFNDMLNWLGKTPDGKLVAGLSQYYLYSFDPATGDRTMISSADPGAQLGTGDLMGDSFVTPTADGKTLFTVGKFNNSTFGGTTSVDVATGNRTTLAPAAGPQKNGDEGLMVPYMDGIYVMASLGMVTLFEPASGNSMFLSR